jgi:F0F1-type ATP synthase delta subunit
MIKSKHLAVVLHEIINKNDSSLEEKFFNFIKIQKLESQLPNVLYRLEKILKKEDEKNKIQIEAPHDISSQTIKEVKTFLKVEQKENTFKINKDLIAGFRARWDGVVYDASFKTGLEKFKNSIIK